MINKKSLWFLTLFSLILVLSIYYITMPNELLLNTSNINKLEKEEPTISIEKSDKNELLVSLRLEADEEMSKQIEDLQLVLTNVNSTTEEKNKAYEKIKSLNNNRGEEEKLEKQINESFDLSSFVKINDDKINITIQSKENSETLANNIMREVQKNFDTKKYITVKFQE